VLRKFGIFPETTMDLERTTSLALPDDKNGTGQTQMPQEILVTDARAGLTPAQMVERRLVALLGNAPVPLSQLQATTRPRRSLV
jgi:hypothetical protein